jgi:hypothetical protein
MHLTYGALSGQPDYLPTAGLSKIPNLHPAPIRRHNMAFHSMYFRRTHRFFAFLSTAQQGTGAENPPEGESPSEAALWGNLSTGNRSASFMHAHLHARALSIYRRPDQSMRRPHGTMTHARAVAVDDILPRRRPRRRPRATGPDRGPRPRPARPGGGRIGSRDRTGDGRRWARLPERRDGVPLRSLPRLRPSLRPIGKALLNDVGAPSRREGDGAIRRGTWSCTISRTSRNAPGSSAVIAGGPPWPTSQGAFHDPRCIRDHWRPLRRGR